MAARAHELTRALLRVVDEAELLPYESKGEPPFSCGHFGLHRHHSGLLVGGFYLVVSDAVPSQVLPTPAQPWLAFAAFDHLTATPPAASNPDTARALRRRMQVVELLARLAMTNAFDWQTQLMRQGDAHHTRMLDLSLPPEPFCWKNLLRELVGSTWAEPTTQLAILGLRWGHPRFLIEWEHDPIPDDFPVMLEQLLSGVADDNEELWARHSELHALLQRDRATMNASLVRPVGRHRVVELGLAFQHGRVTTSLLFGILEVLERFGEAQVKRREATRGDDGRCSLEFRFTTLRFEHMSSVAGSALEHLGDLVRNSKHLYLDELKLPRLVREEQRCLQRCLADLTTPPPPPHPETSNSTTTNTTTTSSGSNITTVSRPLRLACQNDCKSFAVFGSVLRYDSALRALDVFYITDDMDAIAAWLAFGVFHADAASQLTSLCLRMPGSHQYQGITPITAICSPKWVEIFKRVLARTASAEDLAPIDPKTFKSGKRKRASQEGATAETPLDSVDMPSDQRVMVEVQRKTKARAQPIQRSAIVAVVGGDPRDDEDEQEEEEQDKRRTRPVTQFQVLRKLREWIAIAVPGVGAAWIPSSAVLSEHTTPSLAGSSTPVIANSLKSLAWVGGTLPEDFDLRRQHGNALMELLAVVGEPLRVLQLPCNGLQNAHVAQILRCCPNLEELNLSNNDITDIGPLVEAYASGACRITTLNVSQDGEDHARVVQQVSRILELGQAQSDTCTAIERLAVRVTPFDDERIDYYLTDVIPPLQKAIFQSRKLEYARIHCDDIDQGNLAAEITRLRRQEQAVNKPAASEEPVSRALPLRAKLALLSVVRHEAIHGSSALGALDGGVVGLIMQFARTTQMRVVSITADPPLW